MNDRYLSDACCGNSQVNGQNLENVLCVFGKKMAKSIRVNHCRIMYKHHASKKYSKKVVRVIRFSVTIKFST